MKEMENKIMENKEHVYDFNEECKQCEYFNDCFSADELVDNLIDDLASERVAEVLNASECVFDLYFGSYLTACVKLPNGYVISTGHSFIKEDEDRNILHAIYKCVESIISKVDELLDYCEASMLCCENEEIDEDYVDKDVLVSVELGDRAIKDDPEEMGEETKKETSEDNLDVDELIIKYLKKILGE